MDTEKYNRATELIDQITALRSLTKVGTSVSVSNMPVGKALGGFSAEFPDLAEKFSLEFNAAVLARIASLEAEFASL